jgi:multidrug efflux system outer membrane protein
MDLAPQFKLPLPKTRTVNNARLTRAAALALMLGLAGCASIPADQGALPQQDMARIQIASDIKLAHDGWPEAQWWTRYNDPQLNRLIEQALASSPSLEVAAARIGTARAAVATSGADTGLNAAFNASGNRQRYSANGLFPAPIGGNYFNEANLQLQARYDFDWWGKHRAQVAAAAGNVNARRAEYAQAEQVLAAAIAQSYFTIQGGWARRDLLGKSVAVEKDLVADRIKRVAHGLAQLDEQRLAETDLSSEARQLAQLDAQVTSEREALRALLGADGTALDGLRPRAIPDAPHTMPSRLGMELLARRPDLQAARWRVEASLGQIEASEAAFYPDINLAGSIGLDSLTLSDLFSFGSRTLFVGPALSLPLFNSKRLQAGLGERRAERNELIAEYNQSVFNAVRDVAQQGVALQGIESQLAAQAEALKASGQLLHSAQEKFDHGLANRGTLLAAQLAHLKQQDTELQLQSQQLIAEVSLTKALGGGFNTASLPTQAGLGRALK